VHPNDPQPDAPHHLTQPETHPQHPKSGNNREDARHTSDDLAAGGDGDGIFNGTLPDFGGVSLNDCHVTDNDPNDCSGNPVTGTCGS
jgi:hypothetical protein